MRIIECSMTCHQDVILSNLMLFVFNKGYYFRFADLTLIQILQIIMLTFSALLCQNATISLVGLGGGDMPAFPLRAFILKGIELKSVYVGNKTSFKELLELLSKGQVSY